MDKQVLGEGPDCTSPQVIITFLDYHVLCDNCSDPQYMMLLLLAFHWLENISSQGEWHQGGIRVCVTIAPGSEACEVRPDQRLVCARAREFVVWEIWTTLDVVDLMSFYYLFYAPVGQFVRNELGDLKIWSDTDDNCVRWILSRIVWVVVHTSITLVVAEVVAMHFFSCFAWGAGQRPLSSPHYWVSLDWTACSGVWNGILAWGAWCSLLQRRMIR